MVDLNGGHRPDRQWHTAMTSSVGSLTSKCTVDHMQMLMRCIDPPLPPGKCEFHKTITTAWIHVSWPTRYHRAHAHSSDTDTATRGY